MLYSSATVGRGNHKVLRRSWETAYCVKSVFCSMRIQSPKPMVKNCACAHKNLKSRPAGEKTGLQAVSLALGSGKDCLKGLEGVVEQNI